MHSAGGPFLSLSVDDRVGPQYLYWVTLLGHPWTGDGPPSSRRSSRVACVGAHRDSVKAGPASAGDAVSAVSLVNCAGKECASCGPLVKEDQPQERCPRKEGGQPLGTERDCAGVPGKEWPGISWGAARWRAESARRCAPLSGERGDAPPGGTRPSRLGDNAHTGELAPKRPDPTFGKSVELRHHGWTPMLAPNECGWPSLPVR